ncbi:MAG: hypothetical protein GF400_09215 [Candidatus Eisenbacteria bacterium]|nr:hypothetical protein [Candidatus Eisenbacteria bacterium]
MRTIWAVIALVAVCASLVAAAPTTDPPPPTTGTSGRLSAQTGFAGTSETTISGLCVGQDGKPLGDVAAKLYIGGLLVTEVMTSPDGSFEIVELIDYGRDVTVDMWFVPPDDALVMENVILKESMAAIQNGLYSDCVPRETLDPITDFVVRLLDFDSRTRMLQTDDCLD